MEQAEEAHQFPTSSGTQPDLNFTTQDTEAERGNVMPEVRGGNNLKTNLKTYLCGDTGRIVIAALLGVVVALIMLAAGDDETQSFQDFLRVWSWPGKLWFRGLKMVVLPLIFSTIVTSTASLKSIAGTGKLGLFTIAYYIGTTLIACLVGLLFTYAILIPNVTAIDGTVDIGVSGPSDVKKVTPIEQVENIVFTFVTANPVASAASYDLVGIIFFAMFIGLALPREPERQTLLNAIKDLEQASFQIVNFLIRLTPIGVFFLVSHSIASNGGLGKVLQYVGIFLGTVTLALGFQCFVVYPLLFFIFTRQNPFPYLRNCIPAITTALGTSSSAATLPVTYKCAEANGVSKPIAKFVLSLGATINLDGTAIGFPCAVLFLAACNGIVLSTGDVVLVVATSVIASIGAAPIPQAGTVLLVLILETVNIPVNEYFGLILAVDWLYDRFETCTNVTGDSTAVGIINHLFGKSVELAEGPEAD